MRSAPPPVDLTLPSGRRERGIAAALYAVAAAVLGAWVLAQVGVLQAAAWGPLLAGFACGFAGWWVLRPLQGRLRWDGECWWLLPCDQPAFRLQRVELMIDAGGWLLLRVRTAGSWRRASPGRWCAISGHEAGAAWHGLRLALYHGPVGAPSSPVAGADAARAPA